MDRREITKLYTTHYTKLLNYAISLTKSRDKAEDLMQDSFIKAFKHKHQIIDTKKAISWLYKIVYHTFLSQCTKLKRRSKLMLLHGQHSSLFFNKKASHNYGTRNLSIEYIEDQIEILPIKFKKPFNLVQQGYSYIEIADKLSLPIGTVKSRISSAKKKLKLVIPKAA